MLRYFQIKFCYSQESRISVALAKGYLLRDYEWFLNRNASKSSKHLLSDLTLLTESGYLVATQLLSNLITIFFVSALLLFVNSTIFIISGITVAAFYGFLYAYLKRRIKKLGEDHYLISEERFQTVQEIFLGIKSVKIFLLEKKYSDIFTHASNLYANYNIKIRSYSELPRFLFEWLLFGGILLFATLTIAEGNDTTAIFPLLGLFAFAGYRLMPAVQQIYKCLTNLNFISEVSDRILADYKFITKNNFELASVKNFDKDASETGYTAEFAAQLIDVISGYSKNTAVLNGINLQIQKGSICVGLVGVSGSGKTTTIDVLMGLLPASSGEVLLDGIPINNIPKNDLYSRVGYVPQDTYIFNGTIAENICLKSSLTNSDRQKITEICLATGLEQLGDNHEFDPFKIDLGDRGTRLSGGQRQRIGIARALFKKPSLLILDEATSALDGLSEVKLLKALVNNADSITIIIIAHRLDTLNMCDNIFVLENGYIVDQGKFDVLLQRNEMFKAYMQRTGLNTE